MSQKKKFFLVFQIKTCSGCLKSLTEAFILRTQDISVYIGN